MAYFVKEVNDFGFILQDCINNTLSFYKFNEFIKKIDLITFLHKKITINKLDCEVVIGVLNPKIEYKHYIIYYHYNLHKLSI